MSEPCRGPRSARRQLAVAAFGILCLGFLSADSSAAGDARPALHARLTATAGWLARFNAWRGNAAVPALTENTTWSQGDYDHAVYMVKNNLVTHYETPGTPYYTTDGDLAAQNSNIYVSSSTSTTDDQAIDWWMQAPFHAMGMVDPRLTTTGFGSYRESKSGWDMGAAVDVLRGNPFTGGQWPVYFPGNGSTEPLTSYDGNESPNPLSACSGYTAPSGLPVFVETGGNVATTVGAHSFLGNGTPLEHCVIDSNNASLGANLKYRGAVVLIPRQPLQQGVTYTVSLTVNNVPHTWSFIVGVLGNAKTCATLSASAAPASGSATGTQVTVTGAATNCPNPQYRFYVQAPGAAQQLVQSWSSANTYLWTTTGLAGTYRLEVDAKDASESAYDVYRIFNYSLHGCTGAALTAAPTSPSPPGTAVTLTAAATCPGVPNYRFLVNGAVVQGYGAANTFAWSTTGLAQGTYSLEVDVRDQGSTAGYEAWAVSSYKVAFPACTSASLATSPSGRAATGATVTLTASAAGCPTPTYRFLVGGSVVQAYSTTSTFSWNAAGKAPGTYSLEVDVRNQGSPSGYEAYAIVSYSLTGCSAAHLTTSKSSPQAHGTTVVLTATATCPGTPQYRFLVGGAVVQDYSATSSFSWTGTTAGSYSLEVDVRDAGSGAGYESWAIVPFTLS